MRSEQEEDKEAFWKTDGALYTTADGERERKKGISPVGILLELACREWHTAHKNAKHVSRVTFYAIAQHSILRIDRLLLSLSLSLTSTKNSRSRIKNLIIIIKTNSEENDATRNDKHHRISPKTKEIINHRVIIRTCTVVCFLSAFLVMCIMR